MSPLQLDNRLLAPAAASGGGPPVDDAAIYIAAVEAADGQALEPAVSAAYTTFINGCKSDGLWDAMQCAYIMCGARTVAGATVPLRGPAPSVAGFVGGDYTRGGTFPGLLSDTSVTKYIDTNYTIPLSLQNDFHMSAYHTARAPTGLNFLSLVYGSDTTAVATLMLSSGGSVSNGRANNTDAYTQIPSLPAAAFLGVVRTSGAGETLRTDNTEVTSAYASAAPTQHHVPIFARSYDGAVNATYPVRLSFYSVGSSLTLAALDSRVTALMSAIAAALP